MKNVCYALLVLLSISVVGCKKETPKPLPEGLFASETEGKTEIAFDTVKFKNYLQAELFPNKKVSLTTVEVKKQKALGSGEEFYYVYLANKDNTVKIARWLNKKDDGFYFNDEFEEGSLFEQYYLICQGNGDCGPQLYEESNKRMWGCSTDIKCYMPNAETPPSCKVFKSYIEPYKE